MRTKYTNYTAIANNPAKMPKPYQYREQLIHGRKESDQTYTFGQILASWLDLHNMSYCRFAKEISEWSVRNGYQITVSYCTIRAYIHGLYKPKSEIRDLIAAYIGVDDAFLTGYRSTVSFESQLEHRIVFESDIGPRMTSRPGRKVETRPSDVMVGPQAA